MKTQILKTAILCTLLGASQNVVALPLLSESAALNDGGALTLYPDHIDGSKFYFMPNSSRMAVDKKNIPLFSFTHFGLDDANAVDAGAFMVMVSRLASDPDQQAAKENFLRSHPGAGIAILPVQASTISLTALNKDSSKMPLGRFFDEFDFSLKAGRGEDEMAVNASLTKIGAKVFLATLNDGAGAALKMDYCYKVQGLGPAMDATIVVKMDRVYDHFKASASASYFWWSASITAEIEKLHETHDVEYTINGGDAKDRDYIREIVAHVTARLFVPELSASSAGTSTIWGNTPFSFNGGYTHKEELKEERWTIKERKLVEQEFCVPIVLKDLDGFQSKLIKKVPTTGSLK